MDQKNFMIALALTLLAGLSTGLGGVFTIFPRRLSTKFLCAALGFSAGVMIYLFFAEILPGAKAQLTDALGRIRGNLIAVAAFFGGIGSIAVIDSLVPALENPHEFFGKKEM